MSHQVNPNLHRVTIIQQESCATEGLCCTGVCNQSRDCPEHLPSDDDNLGVLIGIWNVLLVALVAFVVMVLNP